MHPLAQLAGLAHLFCGNGNPFLEGIGGLGETIDNLLGNMHPWHIALDKFSIFSGFQQENPC